MIWRDAWCPVPADRRLAHLGPPGCSAPGLISPRHAFPWFPSPPLAHFGASTRLSRSSIAVAVVDFRARESDSDTQSTHLNRHRGTLGIQHSTHPHSPSHPSSLPPLHPSQAPSTRDTISFTIPPASQPRLHAHGPPAPAKRRPTPMGEHERAVFPPLQRAVALR